MRTNQARKQVSCLVRHHNTGDGRLNPGAGRRMRESIYCTLAGVVRDAESISGRLPPAGKALASEIRRDAAWAYRAARDMAAILKNPECGVLPSIDLLPDTSSEVAVSENANNPSRLMLENSPPDTGPLTKCLRQVSVYMHLYAIAASCGDTAIAQDLRAAVHDSLKEIERRVAARVESLRGFGLVNDADAIKQDWAWIPKVLAPITKALLHDGVREKSMSNLIDEEILPVTRDISTMKHNPTGLWSKKRSEHLAAERISRKKGDLGRAWERFRNGFRPGRKKVVLHEGTELRPNGSGGGLGIFEFNELGHIWRVRNPSGGLSEPMVYISHLRCQKCAALANDTADRCPKCGADMDKSCPTPKSHVPMASIPEIAGCSGVLCPAGEALLAGAIQEVWEVKGKRCAKIHMNKSESKQIRSQGGPEKDMSLVQWLVSGETSWVKRGELRLLMKQVFVYGPAIMETTIGQARFCFGAWVDFGDIDIQDSPPKFDLGDEVDVTEAKLMRYETAIIGGGSGGALQVSGTCTGVVVRVPGRATDQTEPMYDIRIGDTVIMHQAESNLRPRHGMQGEANPTIRRMAHRSYNAFDAKGYERYRNRC